MSKTNDYLITFGDVATMGFTSKAAYPGGYNANKIMTKGEIDTYWFVDTTVEPYTTYTSLRCPRYQDLQNPPPPPTTAPPPPPTTAPPPPPTTAPPPPPTTAPPPPPTTAPPVYEYLGNSSPTYSTLSDACTNYATVRTYYSTKSNLNLIGPTDIIYDVYPGTPTNGGNLWVALTSGGTDPKLAFQIGTNGAVITAGGNCPAPPPPPPPTTAPPPPPTTAPPPPPTTAPPPPPTTAPPPPPTTAPPPPPTTAPPPPPTTAAPVAYTIDSTSTGNAYDACTTGNPTIPLYAASGNTVPYVTMILYTNSGLSTPYIGGSGWRKLTQGVTEYAAVVTTDGEITDYATCSGITTTTTAPPPPPPPPTTAPPPPPPPTTAPPPPPLPPPPSTVDIYISNTSVDLPIGGMTINGVAVTYVSGVDFYVNDNDAGYFESSETGTQDVVISYGAATSGQRIIFVDSNSVSTCHTTGGGASTFTITGATITGGTQITVTAEDGVCA